MNKKIYSEIEKAIKIWKPFLAKNRCSFSNQEIKDLENCIASLEEVISSKDNSPIQTSDMIKIVELLLRLFTDDKYSEILNNIGDTLKDIF